MKTLQYTIKDRRFDTTYIITHSTKNNCFFVYEDEIKKENILIYKIVETSKRLAAWKVKDIEPFKLAIEKMTCLGWDAEHEFILV